MASIVSVRFYKPGHRILRDWLSQNLSDSDYIIDKISVTFWNDSDAVVFCLTFGVPNATYTPELLNPNRTI